MFLVLERKTSPDSDVKKHIPPDRPPGSSAKPTTPVIEDKDDEDEGDNDGWDDADWGDLDVS